MMPPGGAEKGTVLGPAEQSVLDAARRRRNHRIALALWGFVALIFIVTLVKLAGNMSAVSSTPL